MSTRIGTLVINVLIYNNLQYKRASGWIIGICGIDLYCADIHLDENQCATRSGTLIALS